MRGLVVALLSVTMSIVAWESAQAQYEVGFRRWSAVQPASELRTPPAAAMPDSIRRKVGYQHWRGGAIGTVVGAVVGTALAFGASGRCADCTVTTGDRVRAAGLITGASGVLGFLVGLASPKYRWERAATTSPGLR